MSRSLLKLLRLMVIAFIIIAFTLLGLVWHDRLQNKRIRGLENDVRLLIERDGI